MIFFVLPIDPAVEKENKLKALKTAAQTGNEYACRWAVSDPDCTEEILIIVVSHRDLNYKVRSKAIKHKNATDVVAKAVDYSSSGGICQAILKSDNFSDQIKEAWIDSPAFNNSLRYQYIYNKAKHIKEKYDNLSDNLKAKLYDRLPV